MKLTYNGSFPSTLPYVVSVGGTSVNGGGAGTVKEIAWDGSTGGVSQIFTLPSWQQGLPSPFTTMRSFPDVAFNSDPDTGQNALVHTAPTVQAWEVFGGTSIAAPQWTGFLALVGQARQAKSTLGYLNPIVYGLSAEVRGQTFHDVTSGNNNGYKAAVGWDAVTGWGSMRADALLGYLSSL
jgi:subtilase family serine protease